jgi:hypothetical protein
VAEADEVDAGGELFRVEPRRVRPGWLRARREEGDLASERIANGQPPADGTVRV